MAGSVERDPAPVEVALRPLTAADEWITAALETDPEVMRHLGGPLAPGGIPALHTRRVRGGESGRDWFFVVHVGGPDGPPAGTICVWAEDTHSPDGGSEIGWGLLPGFQGQGIASAGVRAILELARTDGRWGDLHAFPKVENLASNTLALACGFRLVGTVLLEFRGRLGRYNDWVIGTGVER